MKGYDLRVLANATYFDVPNDIKWYLRRGGENGAVVAKVLNMWVRMMAPITPHVAEEMWEHIGGPGLVAKASFPGVEAADVSLEAEVSEDYLRALMEDVNEILKVTKITPKKVLVYTTPSWKAKGMSMALGLLRSGELKTPTLTKAMMADADIKKHGKEAPDFARKLAEDLVKRSKEEVRRLEVQFDELAFMNQVTAFLSKEIGCEVSAYSAEDANKLDPQNKARTAQPRRPAIYVE